MSRNPPIYITPNQSIVNGKNRVKRKDLFNLFVDMIVQPFYTEASTGDKAMIEALGFISCVGALYACVLWYFIKGKHELAQFGKD